MDTTHMGAAPGIVGEGNPGARGPFSPGEGNAPMGTQGGHAYAHHLPAQPGGTVFYNPHAGMRGLLGEVTASGILGNVVYIAVGLGIGWLVWGRRG